MHGYAHNNILKSGLEHGSWHGASQKKSISWGNAEKRASDAAKRFDRTRAIVQKYQSRYGAAHSFFYLSTLAMLTSL
jgi:hypothetical protein